MEHEALLFQATILPHRSIAARGQMIISSLIAGFSTVLGAVMAAFHAWPVLAFLAAACALALALLHLNLRRGKAREMVLLSAQSIRVIQVSPRGVRREASLPTAWLRLKLQDRHPQSPRLTVSSRDKSLEIGAALGEAEKRDLARALSRALSQITSPRFDNEQLR
jgi:uncharacterized membrane protein